MTTGDFHVTIVVQHSGRYCICCTPYGESTVLCVSLQPCDMCKELFIYIGLTHNAHYSMYNSVTIQQSPVVNWSSAEGPPNIDTNEYMYCTRNAWLVQIYILTHTRTVRAIHGSLNVYVLYVFGSTLTSIHVHRRKPEIAIETVTAEPKKRVLCSHRQTKNGVLRAETQRGGQIIKLEIRCFEIKLTFSTNGRQGKIWCCEAKSRGKKRPFCPRDLPLLHTQQ